MMTNLQSSAFVARTTQLLLSVARLRLLLVMLLTLTASTAWGATETITITQTALELSGSYTSSSKTIDGVTFDWTDLMKNSSNIQAKATSGAIWNSSPIPGNIVSVAVTHSGTARSSTMYFGASAKSTTESSTFSGTATTAPEGEYKYFYIKRSSNAAYWTKIVITYETTPAVNHNVTWKVNGETYTTGSPTTSVPEGSKVTILPTEPSLDCSGKTFVGWSNQEVTDGNKPSVLFTTAENSPAINADTTFYAVFATNSGGGEGEISLTASDFGLTTSYATKTATVDGYSFTIDQGYLNGTNNIQMNSSRGNGILYNTTPIPGLSTITLNVASGTNTKTLYSGTTQQPTTSVGTTTSTETFSIPAGNTYFKIGVSGANYFSSIVITYSTTSYSDYTTSCTTETAVTLNPNGGSGGTEEVTATKGESMPSITLPTRTGYTFNGYYTATSGGTKYYNADGTSAKNWDKDDETVTLYAQWICTSPTNLQITGEYIRFHGQPIELTVTGDNIADDATYTWMKGNVEIENQTSATLTINSCTINDAGNYVCKVSNGSCVGTCNFTIKMYRLMGLDDDTWTTPHEFIYSGSGTIATLTKTLSGGSTYEFKLNDGQDWYGNTGTMTYDNCTEWVIKQNTDLDHNTKITTTAAGTYIFTLDYTDAANPKLSVTYPQKKMVYLNAGPWDVDNAKFAVHTWEGDNGEDIFMEKVDDCDPNRNIYQAEINASHTNITFVRVNPAISDISQLWNSGILWNQTSDLILPTDGKVMYDMTPLYLSPTAWNSDGAWFAAYFYGNGDTWRKMTDSDGNGIYECEKVSGYPNIIFCRMDKNKSTLEWSSVWNQSGNLTIPTAVNNHYTVPSNNAWNKPGDDGNWSNTGMWTTYTPNHTVSFNANGHGTAPEDQCITDGGKATNPGNLSTTGYTFGGWYTDQACNNAWDFENDVVTEDITLYAKWTINTHTLTWNVNDGNPLTGTYTSGSVAYGTVIVPPATPTRIGHTFLGWKETDGSTTIATTMPDKDLTYTAQWQICLYTLTWNLNGGTVTTAGTHAAEGATGSLSGGVEYGASITAPIVEREGYRFDGWYNGTAVVEPATTMGTTNLTYTAQWTKVYTVTFYSNGSPYETLTDLESGDAVTFPATDPESCDTDNYPHFIGWTTTTIDGSTTTQPDLVTSATVSDANLEFHAVFAAGEAGSGDYEKVTSALDDWSGDYLIAYSATIFANGSTAGTSGMGAQNAQVDMSSYINNNTIAATIGDQYNVTLEPVTDGYVLKTKDGKYNYQSSNKNGLASTDNITTADDYPLSVTFNNENDIAIAHSHGVVFHYNTVGYFRFYKDGGQYPVYLYKKGSAANYTSFITSCCAATANLVLTPNPASPIALDIDGNASTTISFATENSEEALYYRPTITPSENTSLTINGTWNNYTSSAGSYTYNFTATGTYTIKQEFKQDGYDCKKSASATINVVANPILQVSAEELTFTPTCGQNSASQEVEINSRYLTANSITATVVTTDGNGQFTISTDNTTFGTSNLTLSGGTTTKVTDQIYVRYEAEEGETGAVAGTLTLKCGSTQKVINLTGTCTCSANVTITGGPIQITAAKDIWVEAATELTITGTFLTTNANNANVSIRAYTNNAAFQIKKGGVTGEGAPKIASDNALTLNTDGAISTADWTGNIGIVYKPTQANTTETATLTVEVYRYNGSAIYSTATYELEGRSLPEQFVIAVTNGSGDWFAVPADMIAPWGDACSGLGTFAPYPISVDNTTAPTIASDVPARAVYQAAARTGNVNTNPQTMSYKSVPLGDNYYLYGSSTSVNSDGSNTNIQNASFAASEKQKWFLDVVDWNTKQYNMHVHSSLTTNVLAYTTAGGANRVGQYSATAGTTKKAVYLLPITGTTCTYYAAPVVTVMAIDATNATIQFKNDRTTAYEISLDQNTWTDLPVTLIKDCNNSEEATLLQAQLPLATYRGQTVYIRAKVTTGTACQETGSFVVPNPTIDRGETPWKYTGTAGQAFSDNSKSITISDLWNPLSVSVVQQRTNSNIQASITPEGVVTVSMAAEDATEGVHEAVLQFISDGASFVNDAQYVGVQITLHSLALQEFDGGSYAFTTTTPKVLCENLTSTYEPIIYLSHSLYKNGTAISTTSELNETNFTLIDLNTGESLSFSREGSDGGIAKITLNETSRSSMIPGHTYRLSWENTNQVMTNVDGLPYMDCYMDFIYSENCDAPTALAACPITQTSFTANWIDAADCTGDVTVNVYTRGGTSTLIDKTTFSTAEVKDLQYVGESNLSSNYWVTNIKDTKAGAPSIDASSRLLISDVSTPKYYNLFSPLLSQLGTISESTIYTITVTLYQQTADAGAGAYFYVMDNGNSLTKNTTPTITDKSVIIDSQTTTFKKLTNGTTTFTVKGLSGDDRIRFLGFETGSIATNKKNVYISSIKIEASGSINSVATKTASCSAGSAEFTDLSDNTTYYYTVTDGSSNTSNEIAVTTYNGEPELKFYSDEACTTEITETTVLGGEETTVYVKGTRVPACAINASVSTGYGMDDSGINYTTGTGVVSGSVILTLADANTTEGTLTITDAEGNDYVLNIVSSDCPAGFGTMALPATNITNESAQANWRTTLDFGDDKSGTLHLYKNGVVNRELIVNGDFETGSLDAGWSNGINNGEVGAAHSFDQYTIKNSSSEAHNGSYSLYVTADGSTLTNFHGQSVMYADYITLTPGTYRMSAWVKMPTASGYDDKMQYFSLGIITGKNGSEHVYTVSTPVTVYSNNTYVQLTHEFEVTSTITACPAIGASSGTFRYFYLDDVSLVCTSIGQSDEPYLSIDIADLSAGNLALTDLSGNTEYTYVIQNADGCSSNPITFQTTEAGAPVITPNDVAITCQVGNSTNGIMTLTVKDVYSDIYISNSCTERITLNTTQLPKEGGVVNFTFTPLNTDQGGETGTCTISFTTKGLSTPATGIITWTVTAGVDPDLPIIDVTDITNTSLNIEHNVEGAGVQIVISRERQEDEIEDNIGEEIFFSKYYEAYMHKKLWAIYNPTKEKISLANTYVWRSNGKGTDWNIEGGLDLSQMGNIESGYIYPNEELIVYTSDQVGECEQSKADMTNWVAMSSSDPALSFSGNDALLLVRKDIDGDADNPPTESVELDSNGDPHTLNWRTYIDEGGNKWWMLDIIGARQNNNKPDISATGSWTWTCNGKTEKGDAAGWYGDQGEHLNATLYTDCGYVLSTNRCLLIRKESVKSGYKAINENIGDMFTLGKNDYPTEWRGAHVPQDGNQEETSCENFTYVGGYDYESYYNAWTDLDNLQPAVQQPDGSWLVEGVDVPNFYCHPLLIEVLITDVVNGEEVENVSAYLEYKVPIVVDEDAKTNDTRYFVEPTPENVLSPEICAECDVVIRDGAKLTHIEDGRAEFRTMQVYPTAKFEIPAGLNMQLAGLHMYAKNDEVGYAIINNDGSSIHAEDIIHIKRIDDMYWYPFSLPYDCKVSSIYQINGKSMGEYWVDWGIKYYDGEARQQEGDNYAGGATSKFWKKLDASETLKAHQGYIIGLFTTEWQGQMKSIYFPPVENTEYTEGGNDAKTTYISNWSDNLTCEPRHRGWNFTGLPYISLFSSQNGDGTTNNNSLMMGSQTDDYATSSIVYVSIPDGGDSRTYTQVSAASVKLEPFKPYFVQAMDPTDGQSHNDIALTYSKGGRTLDKIQARSAASTQATIIVELVVTNADATLTDNAGVLVSDRYTEKYEIGADLMKMYAADRKPQLFTRAINNEMMAYNALPDHLAQNISLGIYLPNTDEYTISIIDYASQLSDAEAVYLLYNGEIVANLLYADYIVQVQQAGLINGYSLDIRRKQKTTTDINNLTDGAPVITIVDGQIVIQQLPDNAEVQIIDVLGRVLYQQANVPEIITFQTPHTGVYNVVITTTEQQFTHKTIIR